MPASATARRRRGHSAVTAAGRSTILVLIGALLPSSAPVVAGEPAQDGTLAYIALGRQEIRGVAADGSGDHRIWAVPAETGFGIEDVAWRPDGGRLAFASGHENTCSIANTDLFSVLPDGSGLERVTSGPACAAMAGLPTGSLSVRITNLVSDAATFVVYAQGASAAQVLTLSPGFTTVVEFADVADLGPGVLQFVSVAYGSDRWLGAAADVIPGGATDAGDLDLVGSPYQTFGALTASWSPDGTRIAYQLGQGALWQVAPGTGVLNDEGSLLAPDAPTILATDPVWSPVADEVMIGRYDTSPRSVEVVPVGGTPSGEPFAYANLLHGIAWLPDGSGWVAADEGETFGETANLYSATFGATHVTQLTAYGPGEHAWWPTVSPDGTRVAYTLIRGSTDAPDAVELRLLDLETGEDTLIVPGGLQADWSRMPIP